MTKGAKLTKLKTLESIDIELGEIASLLGDLANALENFPDQVVVEGLTSPLAADVGMTLRQSEWPSLTKIAALLDQRQKTFPKQEKQPYEATRRSLL